MLIKLQLWKQFDAEECAALLALLHRIAEIDSDGYIVREKEKTEHSCLLISGFAYRQKLTRDGGRSISAVHMQGDVVDLQNSLLGVADHSVQGTGSCENRADTAQGHRRAGVRLSERWNSDVV